LLPPAGGAERGAEKVELRDIVDVDEVVGDETDQAERTWVINVIEESNPDGIEPLGDVGWFAKPVLTSYNLEVRGQAHEARRTPKSKPIPAIRLVTLRA
jgi:hypothetical protein